MKGIHSVPASIGQAINQNRTNVVAASPALLIREMKAAGTLDAVAFKALDEAPDRIDAALTRGSKALVFYRISQTDVRGVVSEQESRLEEFARSAHARGETMLCFSPTLIATMAAMVEPHVNFLIEATSAGVHHDA